MVKNKIKIPKPAYNYSFIQIKKMKESYPQFHHYMDGGRLFFTGELRPAPAMPIYKIRIEFRNDKMPKVTVVNPTLVENPPHYYKKEKCLCLYKPANFYWTASTPLSVHIVPWTSCWLYFYEVWKSTTVWYGPEAEHDTNKPKE